MLYYVHAPSPGDPSELVALEDLHFFPVAPHRRPHQLLRDASSIAGAGAPRVQGVEARMQVLAPLGLSSHHRSSLSTPKYLSPPQPNLPPCCSLGTRNRSCPRVRICQECPQHRRSPFASLPKGQRSASQKSQKCREVTSTQVSATFDDRSDNALGHCV